MKKQAVHLGAVQETLLIPLISRAVETSRQNGLLRDPRAVEIVRQLDYDFDKWKHSSNLSGACVRTCIFDEIAIRFLEEYPDGVIVEIGCGLNTRFERIDNGKATWFDLDLPDSIELRRQFFKDTPRRTMLANSVLDEAWMEPVRKLNKPTLFLSEAVIVYLTEEQVKQAIVQIANTFPNAFFVTDTSTSKLTSPKARKKAMKRLGIKSWFQWACDDPKMVENWYPGIKLLSSKTFADSSPEITQKMPPFWRNMLRFVPFLVRAMAKDYRISHYQFGATATEH